MTDLTDKQRETLEFIRQYKLGNDGHSPSIEDIANGLGIAKSSAEARIKALENKGYLGRRRGVARGLVVL